jgi:hypothetical protein
MKTCAQCRGQVGLGLRARKLRNGLWRVTVRFCSVYCEARYEGERQRQRTLLPRPRELTSIWREAQFFHQGILGAPLGKFVAALVVIAALANVSGAFATIGELEQRAPAQQVMLILRGIANDEYPDGALDDEAALEYATRQGFRGEVLDVAADHGARTTQVRMAIERIRRDEAVTAIYGFSGGGYNARTIWGHLSAVERERIQIVIVVGSPGVEESHFAGNPYVLIQPDPPEGHMAGPKALLESLGNE